MIGKKLPATTIATFLLCSALVSPTPAAGKKPGPALQSLVEAERAFVRASRDQGIRDAFLEFLAVDSVVFRPLPISAKQWFMKNREMEGGLSWRPVFAEISGFGDFGYTTGPYRFLPQGKPSSEATYGDYVSIWRKNSQGVWKVVIDVGTIHSRPQELSRSLAFREPKPADPAHRANTIEYRAELFEADDAFSKISESKGQLDAYRDYSAEDIRIHRVDALPITGKIAALQVISREPKYASSRPVSANVAASGDLGYTYGFTDFRRKKSAEAVDSSATYVRIWRKDSSGAWKIAVDVLSQLPANIATSNE